MFFKRCLLTATVLLGALSMGTGSPVSAGGQAPYQIVWSYFDSEWSPWSTYGNTGLTFPGDATALLLGIITVPTPTPDCVAFGQTSGSSTALEFEFDITPCFIDLGTTSDEQVRSFANDFEIAEMVWVSFATPGQLDSFECLDVWGGARTTGDIDMNVAFDDSDFIIIDPTVTSSTSSRIDDILEMTSVSASERLRDTYGVLFQLLVEVSEPSMGEPIELGPGDGEWTVRLSMDTCRHRSNSDVMDHYVERAKMAELPDTH